MPAVFGLLVAAVVGSVAYLLVLFHSQERCKRWRQAAEAAGLGRIDTAQILGVDTRLTGWADGLEVSLQRYQRGRHERGTRVTIGNLRHGSYALTLRAEGMTSRIEKSFGEREIEVGDPVFDDAAYVQGAPSLVLAVFDAPTRRLVTQLLRGLVQSEDASASTQLRNFRVRVSSDELRLELRSSMFDDGRTDRLLPVVLGPLVEIGRHLRRPDDVAARLLENMRHETLETVRLGILKSLVTEFQRHPATREALAEAVGDASPAVRLQAAIALGSEGTATLRALATGDVPDDIAARAITLLDAAFRPAQAVERLRAARATGSMSAALACVEVLGASRDASVVGELVGVLQSTDGPLASAAARALGSLGAASAEGALVEALAHQADDVRVAAAVALGRVGTPLAVVPLREAASQHLPDWALRKAVREAIAEIQGRVSGASPGQLSIASAGAGQVTLVEEDGRGRLSLDTATPVSPQEAIAGRPADQKDREEAARRSAQAARRQAH